LIDHYRRGVEPFVDDLTSISTRLGVLRRMPAGWWKADRRVEAFVEQKFETHLFSQATLIRDVAEVLNDFREEVDANQKRMLVGVRASLTTADLPEIDIDQYEPFFEAVAEQLKEYSAAKGASSVYSALTILVISETGSFAGVSVVSGLLARFGAAAATSVAAAGGVTAGATATGAGSGTLAGPVGTVVGIGVGLAIGLVIDWWMTEQFKEQMSDQMNQYLVSLKRAILHGQTPPSTSTRVGSVGGGASAATVPHEYGGIAEALPVVCDRLRDAYRERFFDQIVTLPSDGATNPDPSS
jgi:hypothetical protein